MEALWLSGSVSSFHAAGPGFKSLAGQGRLSLSSLQGIDKGGRFMLNMSRFKRLPVGGVWKLGEGAPAPVSSSSFGHGSKLRGPPPIALVQGDINIVLTHCVSKL
ncbi:hypothetical protein TNCV_3975071 [Trichonephila clavipes]|nr:hypothetical protein TNCV_3975071 [Trichonephila clavipes]